MFDPPAAQDIVGLVKLLLNWQDKTWTKLFTLSVIKIIRK